MRDFYVYLVNAQDHIVGREAVTAASVADAIRIGFDALRHWNMGAPTRRAASIEIWSGPKRVFSGRPEHAGLRGIGNPDLWRCRAEEARVLADRMTDPTAKRVLAMIAEGYEQMAGRADKLAPA